jgi:hypothetical protein
VERLSTRYRLYCGALLALFALLSSMASLPKPLWRDEVFSLFAAQQPLQRIWEISAGDFSGPLFYPLLHHWIGWFGASAQAARALTLLISLLTVATLQWHARQWLPGLVADGRGGERALLFGLALLSLNPVVLYYSFELRGYALLLFFTAWTFICAEQSLRGHRRRWWALLFVALAGAASSHALGLLWAACAIAVVGGVALARKQWRWTLPALAAGAVALFAFRDLGARMLRHADYLHHHSWLQFHWLRSWVQLLGVAVPLDHHGLADELAVAALGALSLALAALGAWRALSTRAGDDRLRPMGLAALAALLYVVATYALSSYTPMFYRRYLAITAPVFAVLAVIGHLGWRSPRPSWLAACGALHALLLIAVIANLMRGVGDVDYRRLPSDGPPIYSAEGWDILPCIHYSRRCTLVGPKWKLDAAIGVHWFPREVRSIKGWDSVPEDRFFELTRAEQADATAAALAGRGYHTVEEISLGAASLRLWTR